MIRINAGHLKLPVFAKSALRGLEEDALKPWRWRDMLSTHGPFIASLQ
jgi:hypothetical protein